MQTSATAVVLALATVTPNLGATCPAPQDVPRIEIEARTFKTGDGDEIPYEIGTLFVPENREEPKSRTIGVGFVRIPAAEQPAAAPPVFELPGGPGGSYVSGFETKNGRQLARAFQRFGRLRHVADVVLVDQRGYSGRGDRLTMTMTRPERPTDRPWTLEDDVAHYQELARRTVAEFEERNIDLRGYTVIQCAHDVADLRRELGYDEITLMGTSFGSQWSFAIMRLHPDMVARALLSGVEPLDHGYDMPGYVFAAVQRMWRAVESDDRFEPYLPAGGMAEAAQTVIERLEREPLAVVVLGADGAPDSTVMVLGPDDFPWHDPAQILELYHGHMQRWQLQAGMRRMSGAGGQRPLIGPLIDTSLNVTPERRYRLWNDPATRYIGRRNFAGYLATADIWPSPDIGDELRRPVQCEIPVVFAQGTWDTSTPLENTLEIAPFFVNSRVVIAERGGHGVLGAISEQEPEVWKTLVEFVRTGDMSSIPARVRLEPSQSFASPMFRAPKRGGDRR